MDQRHSGHPPAFGSQPPHNRFQAPLPRVTSINPFYQHQQSSQPHQPYLSSQNQIHNLAHLQWTDRNQQGFNAMGTAVARNNGLAMGSESNSNIHLPILPHHGEDLIALDDRPVIHSHNPLPFQRMQSLPQQPNTTRASATMMGQTTSSYPSTLPLAGNSNLHMDNTIHSTHQSQILPSYHHPLNTIKGHPSFSMQGSGVHQNAFNPQQLANARYSGGQPQFPRLPFQQVPVTQGTIDNHDLANRNNKPFADFRTGQYGMVNTQSGTSVYSPNLNQNMLAQNIPPQTVLPPRPSLFAIPQKENNSRVASNSSVPIVSLPKTETALPGQMKQVTGPSLTASTLETSLPMSTNKPVAKSSATKMTVSPSGSRGEVQQKQTKSGRKSIPRKRSPRSKATFAPGRNVPSARNNTSRRSNNLPEKSSPKSLVAQSQSSTRVVRTVVYNTSMGETTQGADTKVVQSNSPKKSGFQTDCKEENSPLINDQIVSNSNHSTEQLQDTTMSVANGKAADNSQDRLLSFDELFGSSNISAVQTQTRVISPTPEASKDRPPTLHELMQLRESTASKSSVSTISRSPSPSGKQNQAEALEPQRTLPDGTPLPFVQIRLDIPRQVSLIDQDILDDGLESHPVIALPLLAQTPGLKTKLNAASTESNIMDCNSKPSSSLPKLSNVELKSKSACPSTISDSMESHSILASPSIASMTAEPVAADSLSMADLTLTDENLAVGPFFCRFCPDEYRSAMTRDRHESSCRRKAGWPKTCCFCAIPLADRTILAAHARICNKPRAEALPNTPNAAGQANKKPTPTGPSAKSKHHQPPTQARRPNRGTDAARPNPQGRNSRGRGSGPGSAARPAANRLATGNGIRGDSVPKQPVVATVPATVPTQAPVAKDNSGSSSTPTPTTSGKVSPTSAGNETENRPRRRRRGRGARKTQ